MKFLQLLILLLLGLISAVVFPLSMGDGRNTAISSGQSSQSQPPIDENLCPGEILPFEMTVTLPRAPAKGDIVFAFDTTGSMGGVIFSAQTNAMRIMEDLNRLIPNVQFGVIDMEDYPLAPYGDPGMTEAYRLRQRLTDNRDAVRNAINALAANMGNDLPEAYARVVHEAHADSNIGWRENARHLLLTFGDSVAHDDDLNKGVPYPQPYNPGQRWQTGLPPSFLDPGRDGVPGTPDDLDFQSELTRLAEQNITLLSVVTSSTFPRPTHSELVTYWNTWAARTGGKAVPLWNAGDLPELIRRLVEETIVGVIKRLTLQAVPEFFAPWVVFDPAEINDIPVPTDTTFSFLGRVETPADARAGTYQFRILVIGDGIIYGERPVTITVPGACFPDPDYPTWYYLPLIMRGYDVKPPEQPPVEPTPYPGPESLSTRED